jgi:hypothetical protein
MAIGPHGAWGSYGARAGRTKRAVSMLRTNRGNRPSWIFSDRTWDDDAVVERPETVRNISLDEPSRPAPRVGYFPQCGVAASTGAEPVRAVRKLGLVVRLQQEVGHFADQLV